MHSKIQFRNQTQSLAELHDALTGAALDESLGLYQCHNCMVHYHTESYQALQADNNGQCVACSSSAIKSVQ
ncbi:MULTISPECIES: hypothetical protein [Vibrio]|uniref:hypothetical protein n=1 Tax=Vibrio TaxID=662 RepID=UPI002074E6EA|nr:MULTISPECIES: hypothetical protein [Vibrio]USD35626.1 hypothetical protein J8Z27_22725 [Vibrio sp. SCSIO 43186]USD72750.1 hypothetical protein J4N41_22730 [Vibrio sp. SCSIO 43139]USD98955.1 hypothetical protein CTT30_23055 [Vibrio coralliilyticus]